MYLATPRPCRPAAGWRGPAMRSGAIIVIAVTVLLALSHPGHLRAAEATIFAAASTRTAMVAAIAGFERDTGHHITAVYAASSRLARQILTGAPADLFLSANHQWLEAVITGGFAGPHGKADVIASNRLVLATTKGLTDGHTKNPTDEATGLINLPELSSLRPLLDGGRLAIADPNAVPLGMYARQALQTFGLWQAVRSHLAPARNARQALGFVEHGAAALGVLYESDVLSSRNTMILAVFPATSHAPIVYPLALLTRGRQNPAAIAFDGYLKSAAGQAVFNAHGFKHR